MPDQGTIPDWWTNASDRERAGALVAAGGVVMAAVGMLLLPWFEASSQRAGTARRSLRGVMVELRETSDEFSLVEEILFSRVWLPFLIGIVVLVVVVGAFITDRDQPSSISDAAIAGIGGVAYSAWTVVLLNREITAGERAAWALGLDVRVGSGAWVTITGYVVMTLGVLYAATARGTHA